METVLIKKKQPNKKGIVKFLLLFGICAIALKRDRHNPQNDKISQPSKGA
ncbi:hypothetical protein J809_3939 [Acinetobacter sp. 25977_6]|uniref:Uncharacterized protein n=3 Tax=Acinetobacter nosocomialis TaxID=106654 RepID=A0AA36NYY1_ACINO|nr:hypothetical protein F958_00723 [Acinetobacter nosocomialis NIPH 386]EXE98294.1 hypothetical protein J594_2668 [Acinetobacter sp. 259052]EXH75369.1 hypothetical protein J633_2719 [Acinetobacter sp. 216872]EXS43995.1 hypothetical protein J660_2937 [Acinetobacter sp. 88816]EXT37252.1 hypothetical protein J811_3127 [Acinetobacter sp. 25977_8]EXT39517.1 hypothetical protein J809_3939 [Acinetobacter sp. 25977_6]EXT41595.1 hypothetical protein J810_3312 [Acinetobacter sp. 25977_7]EXT47102.1 hyp